MSTLESIAHFTKADGVNNGKGKTDLVIEEFCFEATSLNQLRAAVVVLPHTAGAPCSAQERPAEHRRVHFSFAPRRYFVQDNGQKRVR